MEPFRTLVTMSFALLWVKLGLGSGINLFSRRTLMDNKVFSNDQLEEVQASKASDCVSLCSQISSCNFALYNPGSSQCRMYSHDVDDDLTEDNLGWQAWGAVECRTPVNNNNIAVVNYTGRNYLSTALFWCELGTYPEDNLYDTSVCQIDCEWTPVYLTCVEIPKLKGTKSLPSSSGSTMTCRNEMSVLSTGSSEYAICNADEILTGCSSLTETVLGETGGSAISEGRCRVMHDGDRSIARCCKIPGLQCEYFRNTTTDTSASCFKDFQVQDCSCIRNFDDGVGPCPTVQTNNSCLAEPSFLGWRYALCCTHTDLSCYVKTMRGEDNPGDSQLNIKCSLSETITACSGSNPDRGIQKAVVEDTGGIETCVVHPGIGTFTSLTGYATCCKYV